TESALRSAEALRLARELHDPLLLTRATYVRAAYELRCGDDLPQARRLLEETLARHDEAGRRDPEFLVATRLSLAAVLLREGDPTRAARLRGASSRTRNSVGVVGAASGRSGDRGPDALDRARHELGDKAFEAAFQEGWRLSLPEAVAYAMADEAVPAAPAAPAETSPLTPRERQVARLVAEGMSNRQIAARLVISQRTAESHVENILSKLGFSSRT